MSSSDPTGNALLARLPDAVLDRLLSVAEQIALVPGETLHRFGDAATRLVFPLTGVVSLTVPTPEDDNVEVALVGREGVVGLNHVLGSAASDLEAISQVEGEAIAVPTGTVSEEMRSELRSITGDYAAAILIELAQTAACNRLHSVEERTARWLLHARDRAGTTDLRLTHEFMAMMLGVRRASVTVVVGGFESAGLIAADRRRISLIDVKALHEYSCACLNVIRRAFAPLTA